MLNLLILTTILFNATATPSSINVDKEMVLERHNFYRSELGIEGLEYSDECASYAQEWANTLAKKNRMYHSKTEEYGETLFWSSYESTAAEAIDDWATEKKFFNTRSRKYTSKAGHYTQMIWRDTKYVGMGVAKARNGSYYWVATYYPPGNWTGEKAY